VILGADTVVTVEPPGPVFVTAAPPASSEVVVLPIAGPAGAAGTGPGRHDPVTFTGTWTSFSTAHTFGYRPDVWLIDAAGEAVDIAVEYPDATHVAITFPVPFTGTILLG
jgi:hypothetical protein